MSETIARIRSKVEAKKLCLYPIARPQEVREFEHRHGIELPSDYLEFILAVGNGGEGPDIRLEPLPLPSLDPMYKDHRWVDLPDVRKPFPFTKVWTWDEEPGACDEGNSKQIDHGNFYLGDAGCGATWHLIVTGPDRGVPWMFWDDGIQPCCPKRGFLRWYEDWLDGRDSFYGFPR